MGLQTTRIESIRCVAFRFDALQCGDQKLRDFRPPLLNHNPSSKIRGELPTAGLCALCIACLTVFSHHPSSKPCGGTSRPYYRIVNLIIYDESSEYERQMQAELHRLFQGAKYGAYMTQLFLSCKPTLTDTTHESGDMLCYM